MYSYNRQATMASIGHLLEISFVNLCPQEKSFFKWVQEVLRVFGGFFNIFNIFHQYKDGPPTTSYINLYL